MWSVLPAVLLGGLIGALIPRIAYRLSVEYPALPKSTCTACATPFPQGLAGWVRLGAGCSGCGARNGPPGWLTIPATAAAYGLLWWALRDAQPLVLAAFLVVAGFGVLLGAIDLACLRLPDPLVAAAGGAALLLLCAAALVSGEPAPLWRAFGGAAALGGAYLLLALLPGAHLGFGDVKVAAVLGLLLGWLGWSAVLLGALLPHLINGPVALVMLLSGRAGRRSELPLGPALLAGALLAAVLVARTRL